LGELGELAVAMAIFGAVVGTSFWVTARDYRWSASRLLRLGLAGLLTGVCLGATCLWVAGDTSTVGLTALAARTLSLGCCEKNSNVWAHMGAPSHLACLLYRGKKEAAGGATSENTLF
jgi:hypothetical protein